MAGPVAEFEILGPRSLQTSRARPGRLRAPGREPGKGFKDPAAPALPGPRPVDQPGSAVQRGGTRGDAHG
ncbi:MAG TPA: hypothetical protein VEH31_05540 [Streptosporangiaceae bacterium]|nr:hypothetical protein [Streptosporangiaceae bacterium]